MKSPVATLCFRTDASPQIGAGHLSRSVHLARYLRRFDVSCVFLCTPATQRSFPKMLSEFSVLEIPPELSETEDAVHSVKQLKGAGASLLVVDSYRLGAVWEAAVGRSGCPVVAVDDLGRDHRAAVILDANVRDAGEDPYKASRPFARTMLLGSRYVVLADQFTELRKALPSWEERKGRINVCLGGADSKNVTAFVLRALQAMRLDNYAIDVVVGEGYAAFPELQSALGTKSVFSLSRNPPNLPEMMSRSELAIGAGGTMNWERCVLGLPAVVIGTADNQVASSSVLARRGAVEFLGLFEAVTPGAFQDSVRRLLEDAGKLRRMSESSLALVDGRGTKRVASHLISLLLDIAPAAASDCERVFRWRNHPETRKNSHETAEIQYSSHERWFAGTLASPDRRLAIASLGGEPIGVLRLDFREAEAEVSIYLVPGSHGKKLGLPLLLAASPLARQSPRPMTALCAEIRAGNFASESIFRDAGYHCEATAGDVTKWRLPLLP